MDIALKQAELEQNNLQFAVSQSMQLRQMVIGASQQWAGNLVQLNAQALQFAQGVLQATVELYDIKVKIVQARVEIYRAEAQVYEYRLKAVLAAYDVFKSQVDALRAQVDVDVARVQAFTSQVNAYGALANAYKAVIDGAPSAWDTLKEIADYIAADQTATTAITTALSNRVRFDAAQALTAEQQLQACQNIGIGDPTVDLVAAYTTAKTAAAA